MKTILLLLLLLLVSCGNNYDYKNKNNDSNTSTTSNYKLSTTPSEKPKLLEAPWTFDRFVDEFGDKTGRQYMVLSITGTFSNSATTNSCLTVDLVITSNSADFRLYEYCRIHPVKNFHSDGTLYTMKTKDQAGVRHDFYLKNYEEALVFYQMFSDSPGEKEFQNLLTKSTLLKVHMYETENQTTEYNFNINCIGYNKAFKKLF